MTAAIERDAAARRRGRRARDDVDKRGGAQPILRRQSAGDERHRAREAGLHQLRKAGDAVRQKNAVDAILHIGVLVADVEIAAGGGILRHAGRLQQNFFERRLIALRQRLDRRAVQGVDIGARLGEQLALERVGGVFKGVSRLRTRTPSRRGPGEARPTRVAAGLAAAPTSMVGKASWAEAKCPALEKLAAAALRQDAIRKNRLSLDISIFSSELTMASLGREEKRIRRALSNRGLALGREVMLLRNIPAGAFETNVITFVKPHHAAAAIGSGQMSSRKARGRVADILDALLASPRPLSATISSRRSARGFLRARLRYIVRSKKLISDGKVHRIELLNAFVACRHSKCAEPDHEHERGLASPSATAAVPSTNSSILSLAKA